MAALNRKSKDDGFGIYPGGLKMNGLARISYPNGPSGDLTLPAQTTYELEVLLDHVQWYVRRYGQVRIQLESAEWSVTRCGDDDVAPCALCMTHLPDLCFENGSRIRLCQRCARSEVERGLQPLAVASVSAAGPAGSPAR